MPQIFNYNLYFIGFLLSILIPVPLSVIYVSKLQKKTFMDCLKSPKTALLICTLLLAGMLVAPHFNNITPLIFILVLAWLMVFQVNIEYQTDNTSTQVLWAIVALSICYAMYTETGYIRYLTPSVVSILLVIVYKINPGREKYVLKSVNPYIMFAILVSIGAENFLIFLGYLIQSIIYYYYLRVLYFYIRSKFVLFPKDLIFDKIYYLTKFYVVAWLFTILSINTHVYHNI